MLVMAAILWHGVNAFASPTTDVVKKLSRSPIDFENELSNTKKEKRMTHSPSRLLCHKIQAILI